MRLILIAKIASYISQSWPHPTKEWVKIIPVILMQK